MVVVAILAAGRGTRMKSHLPKVLHSLGGRSLVERVLESVEPLSPSRRIVIVGYQAEEVKTAMHSISTLGVCRTDCAIGNRSCHPAITSPSWKATLEICWF